MQTVRIYRLGHLSPTLFQRLKAAQMEAAGLWNYCCELHKEARSMRSPWPEQSDLQRATHPKLRMKYPWRTKRFYPVHGPTQAVNVERGRVVLPMGRGRASLVLRLDLPENSGACTLVWNRGFELHVCIEIPQAKQAPGNVRATVDLGEIHLAAVTTNTGAAIVVSGRGIRSLKRQRNMRHRQLSKKQARCRKYSSR